MLRLYRSSRAVVGLCRSLGNQIGKRNQSSGTAGHTALEPNVSNMSIFSGHIKGAVTNKLEFLRPENATPIPIYQVLDSDGTIKDQSHAPDVSFLINYSDVFILLFIRAWGFKPLSLNKYIRVNWNVSAMHLIIIYIFF